MINSHQLILFLGPGPDALHLMAEGLARRKSEGRIEIVCSAIEPSTPPLEAVQVMGEIGIHLDQMSTRTTVEVEVYSFDLVVVLGGPISSIKPFLPGMPPHYYWDIPLPGMDAPIEKRLAGYRVARALLAKKIEGIFSSNVLYGLAQARGNLELVLDNLAHAVMAHTMNRRIFYFNKAAEEITGFSRKEVIGKDCHDVFKPSRFCGGDCLFCQEGSGQPKKSCSRTEQIPFTRRDNEERILDMTIAPLNDASGVEVGAILSFKDNTELDRLKRQVMHHHSLGGLVGRDPKMLALFEQIKEVAAVNVTVLIEGDSGTGKELVARAIHDHSPRAQGAFVPVSCGALPEGVLESELFGHVRGAFTSAIRDKKGRFELADGGTLFLDEVAELSPSMQVKLLRVLQEQTFERVGGERTLQVDVRVISATNKNLKDMMDKGRFRRDLYYRLCVVPINPPPLRERRIDIPILVDLFLREISKNSGKSSPTATNEALDLLVRYNWPGNVRELRNVMEYISVKCHGNSFGLEHLPPELTKSASVSTMPNARRGPPRKLNREKVLSALERADGNRTRAAKILGVGRTTLYRYFEDSD